MLGLPLELITMLFSTLLGGVMSIWGQSMKNRQEQNKMMLANAQFSAEQVNTAREAGKTDKHFAWTRRIIVLTVLFGVIIAPFILAHSEEGVTVASEYSKWFGFSKGTVYQTLHGYIILPEIKTAVISIISFYFGSAAVSK